jgi:signal peptidase I
VLASLFAPGVGHLYAGFARRGAVWFAGLLLGVFVLGWSLTRSSPALSLALVAALVVAYLGAAFDASRLAKRADARRGSTALVVAALVGAFVAQRAGLVVVRLFVVEAFKIPAGSMAPTLLVGDHLFVDKLHTAPRPGDVLVFKFPEDPREDFVKRVIGMPGDKLEMRAGRVWLNDAPIPRCVIGRTGIFDAAEGLAPAAQATYEGDLYVEYLSGQSYLTFYATTRVSVPDAAGKEPERLPVFTRPDAGPWVVKPGEFWVLGDNRNNSRDSREWFDQKGGGVPFDFVKGRALWIWLSFARRGGTLPDRAGLNVMGPPHLPAEMRALQPQLDRCLAADPPLEAVTAPTR